MNRAAELIKTVKEVRASREKLLKTIKDSEEFLRIKQIMDDTNKGYALRITLEKK